MAEPDPTQRPFQFSLWTLFVVVTVVALLVGGFRIAGIDSIGVAIAFGLATLVVGLLLYADRKERERFAALILGALLLLFGGTMALAVILQQFE